MPRALDPAPDAARRSACGYGAALGALACLRPGAVFAADAGHDVRVTVERRGNVIVLDVETEVAASVEEAWSVLVDYDHMAAFLPNLTTSQVVKRSGDTLHVAQKGEKRVLFMRFAFAGTKAVELVPQREIRTSLVEGDFRSYQSQTRLVPREGGHVGIVQHGRYEPTRWVPPAIGPALIESETRQHYRAIVAEILRRQSRKAVR